MEKLGLITMYLKHFINTYFNNDTIQEVSVNRGAFKHMYTQLYKHMHCRLDDGVYTASDSDIDRLPEPQNMSKYR